MRPEPGPLLLEGGAVRGAPARDWWQIRARWLYFSKAMLLDPEPMRLLVEDARVRLLEEVAEAHAWLPDPDGMTVSVVDGAHGDLFTRNLGGVVLAEVLALELVIPDPMPAFVPFPVMAYFEARLLEVLSRLRVGACRFLDRIRGASR